MLSYFPQKEHQMAMYNIWKKKNESEDGTFQMNLMKKGSFYCQILSWFRK